MTIDSGTVQWVIALIFGIVAGLSTLVIWIVKLTTELAGMKKDIQRLESESEENKKDHGIFEKSHKETNETLTRLTILFENMDKKQDKMDGKLDALLERRV